MILDMKKRSKAGNVFEAKKDQLGNPFNKLNNDLAMSAHCCAVERVHDQGIALTQGTVASGDQRDTASIGSPFLLLVGCNPQPPNARTAYDSEPPFIDKVGLGLLTPGQDNTHKLG